MRSPKFIIALILTGLVAANAEASTYFVATNGNDANAGTLTAPWRTLQFAVSRLAAGDRLNIRGGTYTGSTNTIDSLLAAVPSGTSWENAITIAGYQSETVTIRPIAGRPGIRLTEAQHYLIFQDLVIDMINQPATDGQEDGIYVSGGCPPQPIPTADGHEQCQQRDADFEQWWQLFLQRNSRLCVSQQRAKPGRSTRATGSISSPATT